MGELRSIVYKPQDAVPSEAGYTRVPVRQAQLLAGYGLEEDAKGGSTPRQVNLMAAETMEQLAREGFHTLPGQLGEQLIIAGLTVDSLPAGTRLQIGESACVECVEPRTGCAKFERHQGKFRKDVTGRLGILARVVVSGTIRVGDSVRVLDKTSAMP